MPPSFSRTPILPALRRPPPPRLTSHLLALTRLTRLRRPFSTTPSIERWLATRLPDRGLVRVKGTEAEGFLQGLVTNDIGKCEGSLTAGDYVRGSGDGETGEAGQSSRGEGVRSVGDAAGEGGRALATAFLTPQGRVLFDAFILPIPATSSSPSPPLSSSPPSPFQSSASSSRQSIGYWIDHPRYLSPSPPTTIPSSPSSSSPSPLSPSSSSSSPSTSAPSPSTSIDDPTGTRALWLHLRKYVLRKPVQLALEPEQEGYKVWAVWREADEQEDEVSEGEVVSALVEKGGLVWRDGRAPGMGFRVLVPSSLASSDTFPPPPLHPASPASHTLHALTHSLPPSITPSSPLALSTPTELPLPLEMSLDHAGAVDFRKGCYVGQELTARTKWTGVVRKRVVMVELFPPSTSPSPLSPLPFSPLEPLTDAEVAKLPPLPDLGTDLYPLHPPASSVRRRSGKIKSWGTLIGPVMYARSRTTGEVRAVGLAVVRTEEALGSATGGGAQGEGTGGGEGGEERVMCIGAAPEPSEGGAAAVGTGERWMAVARKPSWWPSTDLPE